MMRASARMVWSNGNGQTLAGSVVARVARGVASPGLPRVLWCVVGVVSCGVTLVL